jgi:hypothetical protein
MPSEYEHRRREQADDTSSRWSGLIAPHDQRDMGFGVRPAPAGPSVVVLLVSIILGTMVFAVASDRLDLLWLPLSSLGVVELLLARYRLRTDNWRERDWWIDHRAAALLLFGTAAMGRSHDERRGALLQLAIGVAALTAAVLLLVI